MICSRCGFTASGFMPDYSCPSCGGIYSSQIEKKQLPSEIPWESNIAKENAFSSFFETVKDVLLKPEHFFKQLLPEGNILSGWLFALLVGSIGYTIQFIWSQIFPNQFSDFYNSSESLFSNQNSSAETLLFTPLIITFKIWAITFYIHFMLMITRVKRVSMKGTFKVVSYAQSAMILQIIPVFGTIFSFIYTCVLLLIGLNQQHQTSKLKLFFIITLPIIVFIAFVLVILVFILLFGMAAAGFLDKLIPFISQ